MVNKEDIERFLDRLAADGATYSELEPGLWILKPSGELDFSVVVHYSPPVLILRVKVMALPSDAQSLATLSRRLLELRSGAHPCSRGYRAPPSTGSPGHGMRT